MPGPKLTVDIIIHYRGGIVLIERKYPPFGWAIPGGFVESGETVEQAACREAKEETSLQLTGLRQFHVYSAPDRDPRGHTVSVVFRAQGSGTLRGRDDARDARVFALNNLPARLAFDHRRILRDYRNQDASKRP